jgi:hypothetical protein
VNEVVIYALGRRVFLGKRVGTKVFHRIPVKDTGLTIDDLRRCVYEVMPYRVDGWSRGEASHEDVDKWIEDNTTGYFLKLREIYFDNAASAVAFKMRWARS